MGRRAQGGVSRSLRQRRGVLPSMTAFDEIKAVIKSLSGDAAEGTSGDLAGDVAELADLPRSGSFETYRVRARQAGPRAGAFRASGLAGGSERDSIQFIRRLQGPEIGQWASGAGLAGLGWG